MLQLIHSVRKWWFSCHFIPFVFFLKDFQLMLHKCYITTLWVQGRAVRILLGWTITLSLWVANVDCLEHMKLRRPLLFEGLMFYLYCYILQNSLLNLLYMISWYPCDWQGWISWPSFLFPNENLFFSSTSSLLVHGREDPWESQRLKKASEVFILAYKHC